jgi:nitrogen regulatory protein PII
MKEIKATILRAKVGDVINTLEALKIGSIDVSNVERFGFRGADVLSRVIVAVAVTDNMVERVSSAIRTAAKTGESFVDTTIRISPIHKEISIETGKETTMSELDARAEAPGR